MVRFWYIIVVILTYTRVYCYAQNEFRRDDHKLIEHIRSWWTDLSKIQPLKSCPGKPIYEVEFDSESHKDFWTRPCTEYEKSIKQIPFTFRGKIINNLFQGPGKFKKGVIEDLGHIADTCLQTDTTKGRDITTIVGNFKDGKPHGMAKVTFSDGSVAIGKYHEGVRHGLFRQWDANETLREVDYWFNGVQHGMVWKRVGMHLILTQGEKNPEDGSLYSTDDSLILAHNYSSVIVGKLSLFTALFTHSLNASLTEISINDCFLVPKWKTDEDQRAFKFSATTGKSKYENEKEDEEYLPGCQENLEHWNEDAEKIKANLRGWIEQFDFKSSDIGAMYLETLREDLAEDAIKLVHDLKEVESNLFETKVLDKPEAVRVNVTRVTQRPTITGIVTITFNASEEYPKLPGLNISMKHIRSVIDKEGLMQGMIQIQTEDKRVVVAQVKDSVLHGSLIVLGTTPIFPISDKFQYDNEPLLENQIGVIGTFKNGRPFGTFWLKSYGNGYLYGEFNENLKFTGDHMAFVYPDFETVLLGRFENKVMIEARETTISGEKCNRFGVKILKFTQPKPESPVFFFSPPTNESFGEGPQVQDPYEAKMVKLAPSSVPGSGDGVFAKKFIPKETLACPYVGYFYRNAEEKNIYSERYMNNVSLSDYDRRWAKKYSIGVSGSTVSTIEIPIELDLPGIWHPTLGPKVNTDFKERHRNCAYSTMEHPRWGLIQSVVTLKDIALGEELFTDYGYSVSDFPADFLWYHEAKKKMLKELEEEKKKLEAERAKEEKRDKKKKKKKGKKKDKSKKV